MSDLAPIVLFVYNRPEHTRRTLAALAANPLAIDSDLFIYADGPKKPQHAEMIERTRAVTRAVSGFKSVTMIERDKNLGLANSIIAGVSELCSARGRAIVVEDDLLVAPQFLTFLNLGLDRYADQPGVFQISGFMFPGIRVKTECCFLPLTTTWGWATWGRAWSYFDPDLSKIDILETNSDLRRRFDLNDSYSYFEMAKQQQRGEIDSWGIRWYLSTFLQNGLTLYPGRSLVRNIGVDGSGTHGAGHAELQDSTKLSEHIPNLRQMPDRLQVDFECLSAIEHLLRSMKPTGMRRWFGRYRQQFSLWLRLKLDLGERNR
jgi:hypothetical protein